MNKILLEKLEKLEESIQELENVIYKLYDLEVISVIDYQDISRGFDLIDTVIEEIRIENKKQEKK